MIPAAATASGSASAAPVKEAQRTLRVGGLVPLTTTDYPGMLAAVVFCQGCPWRCHYCHNPHLIPARRAAEIAWTRVLSFLERRRGLLDAVVFSGGEPTQQSAILVAVREVRAMGFRIGLHTAGMYPRRLARLLPLVDWVGIDIKAPFESYSNTTGAAHSGDAARESLRLILSSGVDYECRTTVDPGLLDADALTRLAATLAALGVNRYVLQECREPGGACRIAPGAALEDRLAGQFATFSVRRAA
ncbi:MAG: anaerobic ribonucleoside-triphosphate reductase activating protein [Betaproteobacteria bacterium]|nr:anaerobic ribonucleoside-triphosphate reductase activating protein [Betaproteobacteria bacterium]